MDSNYSMTTSAAPPGAPTGGSACNGTKSPLENGATDYSTSDVEEVAPRGVLHPSDAVIDPIDAAVKPPPARHDTHFPCASIEPRLFFLKSMYFCFCAGLAFVSNYKSNQLHSVGLTPAETALLLGVVPFVGLISNPLVALVADKWRAHRVVLAACVCGYGLSFEALAAIPGRGGGGVENSSLTATNVSSNFPTTLHTYPPSSLFSPDSFATTSTAIRLDATFLASLAGYLLYETFYAPIFSLMDAIVFAALGPRRRGEFGRQRMWSPLGFVIFSVGGGAALDAIVDIEDSYRIRAHSLMVAMALTAASVMLTPGAAAAKGEEEECVKETLLKDPRNSKKPPRSAPESSSNSRSEVCLKTRLIFIFADAWILLFVFSIFVFGFFGGFHGSFYGLFLQNVLRTSQTQMGVTLAVACLAETVLLFFSGKILERLGHEVSLVVVYLGFGVRFLSYSLLTTPWPTYLVDALHAVTFGLMWAAAASLAAALSPPGSLATLQAIVGAAYFNLGKGAGSLIGGLGAGAVGIRGAYFVQAMAALFGGVVVGGVVVARKKCGEKLRSVEVSDEN